MNATRHHQLPRSSYQLFHETNAPLGLGAYLFASRHGINSDCRPYAISLSPESCRSMGASNEPVLRFFTLSEHETQARHELFLSIDTARLMGDPLILPLIFGFRLSTKVNPVDCHSNRFDGSYRTLVTCVYKNILITQNYGTLAPCRLPESPAMSEQKRGFRAARL